MFLDFDDFAELAERIVFPAGSHGKVGGKAAGVILARGILRRSADGGLATRSVSRVVLRDHRRPASSFISHNDLEDILSLKYQEIDEIRREYPNIQQLLKNSPSRPT